jgi:hypothetical protein
MNEWSIVFEQPGEMLSMNRDRERFNRHRTGERQLVQEWRNAAYYAWVALFPGSGPRGRAVPPCHVHVVLDVELRRNRDPHNFYPTIKPIVDGIRLAGAWPDDNPDWVTTHEPGFLLVDTPRRMCHVRLVAR